MKKKNEGIKKRRRPRRSYINREVESIWMEPQQHLVFCLVPKPIKVEFSCLISKANEMDWRGNLRISRLMLAYIVE
ncbi:hypothetical protein NC652_031088 [Populus alba x Populus x berolinensis]|nr:hypothetical protein NC652_031088 [Populus alba x Populus x berolinensis]